MSVNVPDAYENNAGLWHQQDDASLEVLAVAILADPSSLPAHLVPEDLPGFSATY